MTGKLPAYRAIHTAKLDWQDGVPYSTEYGDRYCSADAITEAEQVFVAGCEFPAAFQKRTVIVETGFGAGLNFLVTRRAWRKFRTGQQQLHYLSVEKHPMTVEQIKRAVQANAELTDLAADWLQRMPPPVPGFHRRWLSDGVCLTLMYGDVLDCLSQLEARADAIYLDGFAPRVNEAMWSPAVMSELARLGKRGCKLASFTVAGWVRRNLTDAGFAVRKRKGWPGKREVLAATLQQVNQDARVAPWLRPPEPLPVRPSMPIEVAGAGIAGSSVAYALAQRGVEVSLHDGCPDRSASLNPVAAVAPRLPATPVFNGRIAMAAGLMGNDIYSAIDQAAICTEGAVMLAGSTTEQQRQQRLLENWQLPTSVLRAIDADEATALSGVKCPVGGLFLGVGLGLHTDNTLRGLRGGLSVQPANIKPESGKVTIHCTGIGMAAASGCHLPLVARRGQVTMLARKGALSGLQRVLVYGGLAVPNGDQVQVGATFDHLRPEQWFDQQTTAEADHGFNIDALASALPDMLSHEVLGGRAAVRAHCPDRLPAAGALADERRFAVDFAKLVHGQRWGAFPSAPAHLSNQWVLAGLGSHGYTYAPLAAELLASQMLGDPWPLERDLALAMHPNRFLVRRLFSD
ncbi:MAG: tRNA 5-methylaminomethyl-2-thiouridine biosynthesis bifunctional protein MnmC [Lysobacteraceae bacterium]|nr:MAG: tRNA 5-methylaminomethyl-2-thiouridine biosynthesis bifunctional protein MnmC [Xanthomonadaceae bacterium]